MLIFSVDKGCLENSDPKNSDPLGVSKTQTLKTQTPCIGCLENSDPKDKTNLDSECQRMLQAVLFNVRRKKPALITKEKNRT